MQLLRKTKAFNRSFFVFFLFVRVHFDFDIIKLIIASRRKKKSHETSALNFPEAIY